MKKIKELWQSLFPSKEEMAMENARRWARVADADGALCLFVDGIPLFTIDDEENIVSRKLTKEQIMMLLESFRRVYVRNVVYGGGKF